MKYRLSGPPTTETPGTEGDFYLDTDSGVIYICKGCSTVEETKDFVTMTLYPTPDFAVYVWEQYGGGNDMFKVEVDFENSLAFTPIEDIVNAVKNGKMPYILYENNETNCTIMYLFSIYDEYTVRFVFVDPKSDSAEIEYIDIFADEDGLHMDKSSIYLSQRMES